MLLDIDNQKWRFACKEKCFIYSEELGNHLVILASFCGIINDSWNHFQVATKSVT